MVKKTVIVEAKTDGAEKSIDKLKKSTDNLTESTDELSGSLDKVTGGAITKFKGLRDSVKNVAKGFKGLRAAVISTGIGALVIGVVSLIQAFKRSEAGQNKFSKLMGMIGAVTSVLLDRMANLGTAIINVFTNPIQSLKDFAANLKSFVVDKVKNVLDGIGLLGSAIKKVFTGDFSGALADAKDGFIALNNELNPTVIVTKALVKETSNLVKEMKEEAKIAGQIADQRAEADKLERELLVSRAKADRERAELLEKAVDRENFTTQQRIEFLKEAGRVEEQITNQEIEAARLRLEAKQAENALGLSTKEDLDEEAQLKANLIQLETARLTKQKEVTSQTIALINEQRAAEKAIQDEKDAEQAERDQLEAERQAKEDARRKKKAEDDKKAADLEKKLNEDVQRAKLQSAGQTFGAIAQLAGEGSKIGKAAAIAQATISAVQGTQNAFTTASASPITTLFPAYPFIQAGIAAAAGLANIKSIKSTKVGTATAPSPPSATGTATGGRTESVPPAFNIVGASATNQLAGAIGGQAQQPVKAFVVSNDVTTAQELDRNIVEGASLG